MSEKPFKVLMYGQDKNYYKSFRDAVALIQEAQYNNKQKIEVTFVNGKDTELVRRIRKLVFNPRIRQKVFEIRKLFKEREETAPIILD